VKRLCLCVFVFIYIFIYHIVLYGGDISKLHNLTCKYNMSKLTLGNETYIYVYSI
jgi:hypothetical protein